MKRRARLRPRGTLVRPDDAPAAPARDDDRRGHLRSELRAGDDSPEAAGTVDVWLADQACDAGTPRIAHGLLLGDGGISVGAGVAASVARAAGDHGRALRALRALRTARARRLAIALGLARTARSG